MKTYKAKKGATIHEGYNYSEENMKELFMEVVPDRSPYSSGGQKVPETSEGARIAQEKHKAGPQEFVDGPQETQQPGCDFTMCPLCCQKECDDQRCASGNKNKVCPECGLDAGKHYSVQCKCGAYYKTDLPNASIMRAASRRVELENEAKMNEQRENAKANQSTYYQGLVAPINVEGMPKNKNPFHVLGVGQGAAFNSEKSSVVSGGQGLIGPGGMAPSEAPPPYEYLTGIVAECVCYLSQLSKGPIKDDGIPNSKTSKMMHHFTTHKLATYKCRYWLLTEEGLNACVGLRIL